MKLFYSESGVQHTHPPLILLHGFCETYQIWERFERELAHRCRVLCPDLPGFGKSSLPAGSFSLSEVAGAVHEWLRDMKIERCILAGHSLGGYVSLALLEKYPDVVEGIGMINSTAYADTEEKKRSRDNVIQFVEKHGVEKFIDSFVPQLFYSESRDELRKEIEELLAIARTTPKETLVAYTRAMQQRKDRLQVLQHFKKPILYIAGEEDTNIPLADSQKQVKKLSDYELHILNKTGHMAPFEKPEETLSILRTFVHYVYNKKRSS
ncbi:alpha/beta fold hydrolase [Nafulsella turpanensis]|uniref:alpha/beta fold hydrolase n=1 Tax=Nafulsella turpanensis TaxID=1265690 RepID=UPI000347D9E7|nr:alpha/beta hydrolase [Nafulsella turpanensis]